MQKLPNGKLVGLRNIATAFNCGLGGGVLTFAYLRGAKVSNSDAFEPHGLLAEAEK